MSTLERKKTDLGELDFLPGLPSDEKFRQDWSQTLPGRFYSHLQSIAAAKGIEVTVLDSTLGQNYERFLIAGAETVIRRTYLANDEEIVYHYSIESWEYKRNPLWAKAIDLFDYPFGFLDTQVIQAAKDAERADPSVQIVPFYDPKRVVAKYMPHSKEPEKTKNDRIKTIIAQVLSARGDLQYAIQDSNEGLRLVPQSLEAEQSRKEDNDIYKQAVERIRSIVPELEQRYQSLQLSS